MTLCTIEAEHILATAVQGRVDRKGRQCERFSQQTGEHYRLLG